jgi:hypothetical protein
MLVGKDEKNVCVLSVKVMVADANNKSPLILSYLFVVKFDLGASTVDIE